MRRLLLIVVLLVCALAACTKTVPTHTETVRETVIHPAPDVIGVPEIRYVPIDKDLTALCGWVRDGALRDMPEVARGRKRCLDYYEANLKEIAAKQGAPVPLDASLEGKP